MTKCRYCKKPIKLIEVPEDTPAGPRLRWRAFDKKRRASDPYRSHDCPKDPRRAPTVPSDEVLARRPYKED